MSGLGGAFDVALDQGQLAERHARIQQALAVMGEVLGPLPVEIAQVTIDIQGRVVAHEHGGGLGRLIVPAQLRQRRGADRQRLQMVRVDVELLARPCRRG